MLGVVANRFTWSGCPNDIDYSIDVSFNGEEYLSSAAKIYYDNHTSIEIGCLLVDPSSVVLLTGDITRQYAGDIWYDCIRQRPPSRHSQACRATILIGLQQCPWASTQPAGVFDTETITYLCDYQAAY